MVHLNEPFFCIFCHLGGPVELLLYYELNQQPGPLAQTHGMEEKSFPRLYQAAILTPSCKVLGVLE